jgi:hypothetical protein
LAALIIASSTSDPLITGVVFTDFNAPPPTEPAKGSAMAR